VKRALIIGGVVLALLFVVAILVGGRDEPMPPIDSSVNFGKGHAEGRRIKTTSWSCDYDKIIANNDQSIMEVDGVRNGIIYREGKPYLTLTAQHMSVNMLTKDFSANGKLHVATVNRKNPRSFDTDAMAWNEAAQTLSVTSPLTFVSESAEPLRVNSLVYDVRDGTLHMGKSEGALKL
jgi:hypothetical protein